jgi:hypothetical protein
MRLFLLSLLMAIFLSPTLFAAPPDEGYQSENTHKGIRPARPLPPVQDRKKDDKKPEEVKMISADDVEKLKKLDGKEVVVEGKVVKVYVSDRKTVAILNFGSDHRKCFTAPIFPSNWGKWDKGSQQGLDVIKSYEGKTVQISGMIGIRNDLPQIIINVPSQIRVK